MCGATDAKQRGGHIRVIRNNVNSQWLCLIVNLLHRNSPGEWNALCLIAWSSSVNYRSFLLSDYLVLTHHFLAEVLKRAPKSSLSPGDCTQNQENAVLYWLCLRMDSLLTHSDGRAVSASGDVDWFNLLWDLKWKSATQRRGKWKGRDASHKSWQHQYMVCGARLHRVKENS